MPNSKNESSKMRKREKFYVVLDDDETYSMDGYIVLDGSLSQAQRDDLEAGDKVFKYEGVPFISIDELIEMLELAGLWGRILEELGAR